MPVRARVTQDGAICQPNLISQFLPPSETCPPGALRTMIGEPEAAARDIRVHAEPSRAPADLDLGIRARVFSEAPGAGPDMRNVSGRTPRNSEEARHVHNLADPAVL